jgi:hypothetical protein
MDIEHRVESTHFIRATEEKPKFKLRQKKIFILGAVLLLFLIGLIIVGTNL